MRSKAAEGVRAQWVARYGECPPVLAILGAAPHWLVAVCHARAVARGDVARELYASFEAEIAAAFGHAPVEWPPAWGVVVARSHALPRAEAPDLVRLDPAQALAIRAAEAGPLPIARMVKALLEAAFGSGSPDRRIGDETRARLLGACMPPAIASRWRGGLGLEPPAVLVPDAVLATERLLAILPAGAAIDPAEFGALELGEIVDCVCTVAAVRLALRAGGSMPVLLAA
jgi:hypothetical protein